MSAAIDGARPHPLSNELIAEYWPGQDAADIRRQFDDLIARGKAECRLTAEARPGVLLPPVDGQLLSQEYLDGWVDGQTYLLANQAGQVERAAIIEECAKVAEAYLKEKGAVVRATKGDDDSAASACWHAWQIAQRIRALATPEGGR